MKELKTPIENHCCEAMEHCETTSISKRCINGKDRWMWEQTQKNGYIAANEIMFCPYCGVELNRRAEPVRPDTKTDELIKELRNYGLSDGGGLGRHMGIMDEAADRLEELNRRAEPENKALITVEQVQEFYEFLQGNIPYNDAQNITFSDPPKVSKETAVDIIYYLQEVAHIIPDTYESCKKCGDFFDSDNDGCLAGFCECCGCQHPEFVEQEDGCVKCEESLYARKPEGSEKNEIRTNPNAQQCNPNC